MIEFHGDAYFNVPDNVLCSSTIQSSMDTNLFVPLSSVPPNLHSGKPT